MTISLSLFALLWLPYRTTRAWFLTEQQKQWVEERMFRDSGGQDQVALGITRSDVVETLKDWKFCT
jgi:hypothetical protein